MTKDITIRSVVCGRRIFAINDVVSNGTFTLKIAAIHFIEEVGFRLTDKQGMFLFLDTLIKKVK